ncbi:uncharacterized protein B0I36DRAFT_352416 [Microdochium trichocladiopsis]|uniref:Uncharacterized protein n=1 Tax=Microdochium trichocladiopsis TaxID=1682393 RepID=A0A9P9BMS8_9PEZI|nr:uncharacterized protein B0I36DRAFT_352416 [Microdochium trichocladiopsis]KAH7026578.1 hypothetical protein B0I36DRAFT_352416 [Microdochium trichocladiopsis]
MIQIASSLARSGETCPLLVCCGLSFWGTRQRPSQVSLDLLVLGGFDLKCPWATSLKLGVFDRKIDGASRLHGMVETAAWLCGCGQDSSSACLRSVGSSVARSESASRTAAAQMGAVQTAGHTHVNFITRIHHYFRSNINPFLTVWHPYLMMAACSSSRKATTTRTLN